VTVRRRLDVELVRRGLVASRAAAQAAIDERVVTVAGALAEKPSRLVAPSEPVELLTPRRFVGRGGEKLEGALDHFSIDVTDRRALDAGASTGGFTDCLLQRGAREVIAVDVGHGQLDARLRADPRVVVREKVNARALSGADVPEPVELAVADVSFISLRLILPAIAPRLALGAAVVVLVKPQFEAGRGEVPRGGVVKSEETRRRVVGEIEAAGRELGWAVVGSVESPIRGARGNAEFLVGFRVN